VTNFERFQHYKDRSPPWIKLYNELLDNYEFACLQDASKAHLIAIWLLASRSSNRLPYDSEWIERRVSANSKVDLDELLEAGFIELEQLCSSLLAERKQPASPEREGEGETDSVSSLRSDTSPLSSQVVEVIEPDPPPDNRPVAESNTFRS